MLLCRVELWTITSLITSSCLAGCLYYEEKSATRGDEPLTQTQSECSGPTGCENEGPDNGVQVPPENRPSETLVYVNFDGATPGKLDRLALTDLFVSGGAPSIDIQNGVDNDAARSRVSIDISPPGSEGNALCITYPEGGVGPRETGAQWHVNLPAGQEELTVSYKIWFSESFDFRRGGKLPGFYGGRDASGCVDDKTNGWSTRIMWREDGLVSQYLYHTERTNRCGEYYNWNQPSQRYFQRTNWHTVSARVKMNTLGTANGILETWFDGESAALYSDISYQTKVINIESLYFSTFHGGSNETWAPLTTGVVCFDEIKIAS